jgi:hypothetical protein
MTDCCGHAAHLAVASFFDAQLDPAGWDEFATADGRIAWPRLGQVRQATCLCGAGKAILEHEAVTEGIQGRFIGDTFHLHPIGFFQLVLRIGDARLGRSMIGQDHQAFAVAVEATGRIKAGSTDVFRQSGMVCTI